MPSALDQYLNSHTGPLAQGLDWIESATHIHTNYPRMMCGPVQGKLLTMLAQISGARKALEIGTFTGYSAACIALGLPEDGHLDTLEIDDELEDITLEGWRRCGVSQKITLRRGNALASLSAIASECSGDSLYDFAYIDADKREYIDYYEAILPVLRPCGLIVADDVLLGGKPYDESCHDAKTEALRAFNDHIKNDPRTEVVIVPLRDGISLIRKL